MAVGADGVLVFRFLRFGFLLLPVSRPQQARRVVAALCRGDAEQGFMLVVREVDAVFRDRLLAFWRSVKEPAQAREGEARAVARRRVCVSIATNRRHRAAEELRAVTGQTRG